MCCKDIVVAYRTLGFSEGQAPGHNIIYATRKKMDHRISQELMFPLFLHDSSFKFSRESTID